MDKQKLRELLESDINEITLTLDQFIRWYEEHEQCEKDLDLLEAALEQIANGEGSPKEIAITALNEYRGD